MTKDEILHYLKEVEGDIECLPEEVYDEIDVITDGRWIAGHKHEQLKGHVIRIKDSDIYLMINLLRVGSAFTEWDYVYQGSVEVKPRKIEITDWVAVEE